MDQQRLPLSYPRMTREQRLDQFEDMIYRSQNPLTERQICAMAALRKSPYTHGILLELCALGTVRRTMAKTYNNVDVWLYEADNNE